MPADHPVLSVDQLVAGRGDPVLVVDFVQFSAARQLSEELAEHAGDRPVHRIDPVTDLARDPDYRPFGALVDGYAALCRERGLGGGRLTVVGQCSAAPLAAALAGRLGGPDRVRPVLVEPRWPDAAMVAGDLRTFRTELGADPGPGPAPDADPARALRRMAALLREDLQAMARRDQLDPASAVLADLLARYRAWLGFLLASSAAPAPAGPPVVVPAADTGGPLAQRVLACAWSDRDPAA
ncbi:MAG TPA: hypothetical protein VE547_16405 [Mycobacteriales bacterium]|nr:hypothetical protein [Mycobacteriales bacterium]